MGAGRYKVTKVLDDTVLPGIGLRCQVDGEKKKRQKSPGRIRTLKLHQHLQQVSMVDLTAYL